MPRVINTNPINLTQGHCWAPTLPQAGSQNVYVENFPAVRVGDAFIDHTPGCTPIPTTHSVIPVMGSTTVFVNNLPLVRDGDPMACGDVADNGALTVYADGGGDLQGEDPGNTIGYGVLGPVIAYPSSIILVKMLMEYIPNRPDVFLYGCPLNFSPVELYSPMIEEDSGTHYKNYPGPPLTVRSGAELPIYADSAKRAPLRIEFSFEGELPQGILFQNGRFVGSIVSLEESKKYFPPVKVTAINTVASTSVTLSFRFQKIYGSC
jgi:uncharacterized Zn-binding protein involved in type VI secretion